jgi:hypothetical protein
MDKPASWRLVGECLFLQEEGAFLAAMSLAGAYASLSSVLKLLPLGPRVLLYVATMLS